MRHLLLTITLLTSIATTACGGYKAADEDDLEAEKGQIVGVLVDSGGKAHPDATIQLIASDATTALVSSNMDSDGSFTLYPPSAGSYNVIGILSDTDKVIKQNIVMNAAMDGINIGKLAGQTAAILSVQVTTPDGIDPDGVSVAVLGTTFGGTTATEGLGVIAGVPAGTYKVRFSKAGLTEKLADLTLASGEADRLLEVSLSAAP